MIRYGELRYISKNVVEIGMFNPKSGDDKDVLVVNFFVKEEEALKKICTFIEYMTLQTYITTSTSTYIDDEGYYLIYVELEKNKNTYKDCLTLIKQFTNLTLFEEWNIHIYKKRPYKISVEDIKNEIDSQ